LAGHGASDGRRNRVFAHERKVGFQRINRQVKAGAINAALLATAIVGNAHPQFRRAYEKFRAQQTERGAANRQVKA
jgi:hypothetical protein